MIYHEDGILDLVVGLTILLLAVEMAFDLGIIALIGIPIIFYIPIKERVAFPRIGLIRFNAETDTRKTLIFLFLFGGAIFLVFAFFLLFGINSKTSFLETIQNYEIPIFASLFGGTLWAAGFFLRNRRFLVYAIIGVILIGSAYILELRMWIPVTLVGITIEGVALNHLINFHKRYPIPKDE